MTKIFWSAVERIHCYSIAYATEDAIHSFFHWQDNKSNLSRVGVSVVSLSQLFQIFMS